MLKSCKLIMLATSLALIIVTTGCAVPKSADELPPPAYRQERPYAKGTIPQEQLVNLGIGEIQQE